MIATPRFAIGEHDSSYGSVGRLQFRGGGVECVEDGWDERVSGAGWQQGVDVAGGARAGDGSEGEVVERVGEELRGERDGESAGDEGADGELVVGDRDEVRLEAGGAAGADDQSVGRGGGPVVVAEVGETHFGALGQAVVGCERDHELLAEEVTAFDAGWLLPRAGAVLEGDREVQLTGSDARRQVVAFPRRR